MKNKRNLILAFVILVVLIVTALAAFYLVNSKFFTGLAPNANQESVYLEDNWVSSSFVSQSQTWSVGENYQVEIVFTDLEGVGMPVAATIEVMFDPGVLKVNSVVPGTIWDKVNTLEENIDNQNGIVRTSYAQAMDGATTQNQKYMTIEFEVLNSSTGKTSLRFSDRSEAGWLGEPQLYSIPGQALEINLN